MFGSFSINSCTEEILFVQFQFEFLKRWKEMGSGVNKTILKRKKVFILTTKDSLKRMLCVHWVGGWHFVIYTLKKDGGRGWGGGVDQ